MHGYGGSGFCFSLILKDLAKHFHIIAIDILGMGGSSRPEFNCESVEEADTFFDTFLE